MPRFFCDYCDTYLTHDSAAGRKQHMRGWKHREAVKQYYDPVRPNYEAMDRQAILLAQQEIAQEKGAPLMVAPGAFPVPGMIMPGMVPGMPPGMPGMMPPRPMFGMPPGAPGQPPRPTMMAPPRGMPPGAPGAGAPPNGAPAAAPAATDGAPAATGSLGPPAAAPAPAQA
uniref:U1 small nuclear ribonucleoprotein C n=1 Tax=Phaeomonas parva TaxID=124430 RepID=A0A7S1U3C6_9STRA|mmetsp:Transcript_29400/g.94384  ORF Transcript_29400/g.94384 Transcript_29400/m.94384 type:complete len:170 (+) Transcript_29400:293-802(+)|eukprot:CAMPEP_0118876662 /NCGR_PEP_ID=MMETSP1163-20130328/17261_1 /TAXON_ID=124430 /ORGANISM="Phaeomonas parva, Strain CCMP2877" /LENGTH=169 /DNA_ID=CAMNT_0006812289 /DNA_START=243 /DNA_END=752 /DNA_ORIENTATION=-